MNPERGEPAKSNFWANLFVVIFVILVLVSLTQLMEVTPNLPIQTSNPGLLTR